MPAMPSFRLLRGSTCLVVATALLAPLGCAAQSFSHLDWELVCDNTGSCRAAGYQPDGDQLAVSVLLTRRAGPATVIEGRVRVGDGEASDDAPARVTLVVDGKPRGAVALGKESLEGALSAAQVDWIVRAAVASGRVVIRDGRREWELSGAGATAVLLRMDDVQGRLGTPSALVRKGSRAEAGVPRAVVAPVVVAFRVAPTRPADAELGPMILKAAGGGCDASAESREELRVWRLDERRVLVSTLCWRAAYNEGYGFWIANDRAPFEPRFVTDRGQDFDAATGTISAVQKGRGVGDCTGVDEWVWDGAGFVHTASSTSGLCKGIAAGGTWNLPTLVSDVKRARR